MKSGYLSKVTTKETRTCRCKAQKLHRRKITSGYASLEEALTKVGFHQCKNTDEIFLSYVFNLYSDFNFVQRSYIYFNVRTR